MRKWIRTFWPELLLGTFGLMFLAAGMTAVAKPKAVNACPCRSGPCECDDGAACRCGETKR